MRNAQHIGKSAIEIQNDFTRAELSHFPSENVEKRPTSGCGEIDGPAVILLESIPLVKNTIISLFFFGVRGKPNGILDPRA